MATLQESMSNFEEIEVQLCFKKVFHAHPPTDFQNLTNLMQIGRREKNKSVRGSVMLYNMTSYIAIFIHTAGWCNARESRH